MNGIVFLTNDSECKEFLALHNQLQNMVPIGGYDHVFLAFHTEDAYCAARHDVGHEDPRDNGYTVLIIPKTAMDLQTAAQWIAEFRAAGKKDPDGEEINIMAEDCPAFN